MASFRRLISLLLACGLVLSASPARAEDPVEDLDLLLSNPMLSEEAAQALVEGSPESFSTSSYDLCPPGDPAKPPTFPNIAYKQFTPPGGLPTSILLDEYAPPPLGRRATRS